MMHNLYHWQLLFCSSADLIFVMFKAAMIASQHEEHSICLQEIDTPVYFLSWSQVSVVGMVFDHLIVFFFMYVWMVLGMQ